MSRIRIRLRRLSAAALAGVLLSAPAAAPAQETAPRRLLPAHEQREWAGVGRLNVPGGGYCTATLLSENLAVTAAHCLFQDGRRRHDSELFFAAGYRRGEWEAIRQARRTAVHPDYEPTIGRAMKITRVFTDLALIELDAPVLGSVIPHYPPAALPNKGGAVALLSYGRGRSHALSLQEPCRVTGRKGDVAELTCEVAPGSSGAPVFRRGPGGAPQMVAIISGHGPRATYAAVLDGALAQLKARLTRFGAARKSVSVGGGASAATGAAVGAGGSRPGGAGGFRAIRPGGGGLTSSSASGGGAWKGRRPPGN